MIFCGIIVPFFVISPLAGMDGVLRIDRIGYAHFRPADLGKECKDGRIYAF